MLFILKGNIKHHSPRALSLPPSPQKKKKKDWRDSELCCVIYATA